MGAGNGCKANLRAPLSKSTPEDFTGIGGMGYGLLRGGSKGLAPPSPQTPFRQCCRIRCVVEIDFVKTPKIRRVVIAAAARRPGTDHDEIDRLVRPEASGAQAGLSG